MGRTKIKIVPKQANRLKHVLSEFGISQNQLARESFISQQKLSRVATGKANLDIGEAESIVRTRPAFGFRWQWLIGADDFMTEEDYKQFCRKQAKGLLDDGSLDDHSMLMKLALKTGYIFSITTSEMSIDDIDLGKATHFMLSNKERGFVKELSVEELEGIESQIVSFTEFLLWKTLQEPDDDPEPLEKFDSFADMLEGGSNGE